MAEPREAGTAPQRAGLVLISLILVAGVANLNLSVANVALPDIGRLVESRGARFTFWTADLQPEPRALATA
jgi:hypothetical protein